MLISLSSLFTRLVGQQNTLSGLESGTATGLLAYYKFGINNKQFVNRFDTQQNMLCVSEISADLWVSNLELFPLCVLGKKLETAKFNLEKIGFNFNWIFRYSNLIF